MSKSKQGKTRFLGFFLTFYAIKMFINELKFNKFDMSGCFILRF